VRRFSARAGELERKDFELELPESWPESVRRVVEDGHDALVDYHHERQRIDRLGRTDVRVRIDPPANAYRPAYDALVERTEALLRGHRLVGYHCTRLTAPEALKVRTDGLRALSPGLVQARLEAVAQAGLITQAQYRFFLDSPMVQAHLANRHGHRTGKVWLCPNQSNLRDPSGVYPLFRSWGGEALYAGFEDDAAAAGVLRGLGQPAIVKCAIPLPVDDLYGCRAAELLSNAVRTRIAHPEPSPSFDWKVPRDLGPSEMIDVIAFEDPRFEELTGHRRWPADYRLD